MVSRQSACFCVVIVQIVYFLVCRCWCRCELNRRRRVKRFKRCLRLRSGVFRLVGSRSFLPPCSASKRRPPLPSPFAPLYMHARAIPYIRKGDRVLKVPRRGGVSPPRTILINSYSKTQTIHLPVERAGIRGQRWGELVQKVP